MTKNARTRPFPSGLVVMGLVAVMNVWAASAAGQSGGVTYLYDASGRLVGVVDSSGATAVYTYDAVGNLLSIQRQNPGTVSILAFTPTTGAVGAPVTISGTGFSATPSQNALSFNGVAATVTASTPTQLTTTVPATATTGQLSVTSPNGSASSSQSFVVTSGGPSITGFTPAAGVSGTTVTITGTNFDAAVLNDRTLVNASFAAVSAATTTSLTTTTPNSVGSGRLTVTTPLGTAISAADLIVPPFPYTPSDVSATARMPFLTPTTLTMSTANTVGLALFDGVPGQRVFVDVTNRTLTSAQLALIDPVVSTVASVQVGLYGHWYIDTAVLPRAGTYTVLVDPSVTYTGNVTFKLYDVPADVTGTIAANGTATTVTTTTPGQNARLSFTGTAGQRVALTRSNLAMTAATAQIRAPDSSVIATLFLDGYNSSTDAIALPATGAYAITIDPTEEYTGHVDLTLYDVPPDVSGTIQAGGAPVTVTINAPYQNAQLTFSGTSGQRISLQQSNTTIPAVIVQVLKPDGTFLGETYYNYMDAQTLPTTGTYTIKIDPMYSYTGSTTLQLNAVPADVTGPIVAGGAGVPVTISTPGQNAALTFSGTSGQRVSLQATGSTIPLSVVSIVKPDGTTLATDYFYSGTAFRDVLTLPVTGTYTIRIDPSGSYTGSTTLTLYSVPADSSGTIVIAGSPVTVTTTTPGQNGTLTFSGTASQSIYLQLSAGTYGSNSYVSILKPDQSVLMAATAVGSSATLPTQVLPVTGTYTIKIDPTGAATGSITVAVRLTPSVLVNGTAPPTVVTVSPSAVVTVSVSNGPANTTDWIALSLVGSGATSYISWQYLNGTHTAPTTGLSSATLTFTMPATTGNYEFRFLASNGYTRLATSTTVTVQ
jgi:YD repeat-containing protein